MKKCSVCSVDLSGRQKKYCTSCGLTKLRARRVQDVLKRRSKLKQLAIEYKGGKCVLCGYNRYQGALDFHHKDPSQKDFGVSNSGLTRSWKRVKQELDKCVLVCANCHREVHAGLHEGYSNHEK